MSLHLSKYHIVGNHMSWLIVFLPNSAHEKAHVLIQPPDISFHEQGRLTHYIFQISDVVFTMLINVGMSTIVDISLFMSMINFLFHC